MKFTSGVTLVTEVTWSVLESGGGTIDATGLYTAPDTEGTFTVVASAQTVTQRAEVHVTRDVPSTPGIGGCTGLVSGSYAVPTSPLASPDYLQSTTDPDFGTRITRVTGDWGSAIPTTWATDASLGGKSWRSAAGGPTYSHDDAWNADESLLICKTCVEGGFLFMDGGSYHPLFQRSWPTTGGEVRWHPTDASKMLYVGDDATVGWWYPSGNTRTQRYSPSSDGMTCSSADFGGNNGNPSWDGRRIMVFANCPDQRFWVVDLDAGARISPIIATSTLMARADWPAGQTVLGGGFTFPTSNYVKVGPSWQNSYVIPYTGTGPGDWSVTSTISTGHEDVAVDANGNDVTFNGGTPEMWNAATGVHTALTPTISANQYHTSGKLYRAPGWGISTTDGTGGILPGEIIAQELEAGGVIRRILHHRTALDSAGSECTYSHCPFAVPAHDGKRVFYNSDWGDGSGPVYGYVGDVRNLCP